MTDLGITPATNALPINRLRIPVGESRKMRAAWVQFPQFTGEAAQQSYERLALTRYRCRSISNGFAATIEVDDSGLPIDYSGIWRRVAAVDGAAAARALVQGPVIHDGFSGGPDPSVACS